MKKVILLLLAAAMIASCGKKDAADAKGKGGRGEAAVFAVNTTTAVQGQISDYIELSGDLVPGSAVDAYSDAAGKITRVNVAAGSRVTRGQAIASVDPSKPGMTYVQHIVRSPISGTITSVPVEVGMTVSQAMPIARIAGGGGLEVELFVPERFISKVRKGLLSQIEFDAYPGELFRGSVGEVSPIVDVSSRTEKIKVNVDNPGSRLKAGMFAKVKIVTESKSNIVKIPAGCVITREGKDVAFIVTPDPENPGTKIARQLDVTRGIEIDSIVEIVSGLEAGDEIVSKGMSLLGDGTRVNVVQKDVGVAAEDIYTTGVK
jgi:multidrug efflux pump subunit AcrA (membrane-fusion protein)